MGIKPHSHSGRQIRPVNQPSCDDPPSYSLTPPTPPLEHTAITLFQIFSFLQFYVCLTLYVGTGPLNLYGFAIRVSPPHAPLRRVHPHSSGLVRSCPRIHIHLSLLLAERVFNSAYRHPSFSHDEKSSYENGANCELCTQETIKRNLR
jgi:hypothetical protein